LLSVLDIAPLSLRDAALPLMIVDDGDQQANKQ
jgi:hypothetical protein